ncbi:Glutarate-semialdehyde dehydrogenase DavD [Marinomonas spartinae]|uniref:Glutarate-semialdehyde dehydrogenase DavD n=1 Tax=Marinomonas spartinae TaxID=1792290 RepID=A0A1A8TJX5_9GAMM|nr:NAD-dependent succinate-semialdehyde dehydrogenase [Marinomonas spartinae]SBS26204.1 Glutarate-semialdehyde dehydrogenase DavD [Marinomonas spartinae]SBS32578.1 Glutarate-semialdehyde dehydrogenase DavD [Marinomonas spartinae]
MILTLKRPDLIRTENFINGQWQPSNLNESYPVNNPATGQNFAQVANSTAQDATQATKAAYEAFEDWRNQTTKVRSEFLLRWHQLILDNAEDLARLMSLEQGKPLAEARGEVAYGASYVDWFASEALRTYGDIIPETVSGKQRLVVKEAVGVVAAITPWNFPLAMIARKIAPALAAGCTVVAKPAEDTPLTALALVALADEAGLPAGVLNIVTSSRDRVSDVVGAWLEDARVRKITFTGSTAVGKLLAREAAATLKHLSLELGGNAPFIVFEDADIDAAVEGLMVSKFRNGGQTCVCPNRVYVHNRVYDAFADKLVTRVAALHVGPSDREESQIGPMINERAVEKIERHVQNALQHGATILTGGTRIQNDIACGPHYYAPTVLANANHDMELAHEETFGPVAPLFRFENEEEVIQAANNTPFGLAGYFYSNDIKRVWRVANKMQTGIVGINEGAITSETAPFGGVKESGYGREGSRYGLDDYMEMKYLCQGNLS